MRRKQRARAAKKKSSWVIYIVLVTIVCCTLAFFYVLVKIYNIPKFVYVDKKDNDAAEIIVIDSKKNLYIKYEVSPDIELDSAYGYGNYKIKSLWTLGKKEGFNGSLVAKSLLGNLQLPIYLWDDGEKTNLNFFQKIKAYSVDKSNSSIVQDIGPLTLTDSIKINFMDSYVQESGTMVEISDLTGDPNVVGKVSNILEVMGTKVSNYTKGYDKDFDCEVFGEDNYVVERLGDVFDCKKTVSNVGYKLVKLKLGSKFADRF